MADNNVAVITVISNETEETPVWCPSTEDQEFMLDNGVTSWTAGADRIGGGLYEVHLTDETIDALREWQPINGWTDQEQPAWMDMQRGEGGLWLKLPSGTWIGIAPIDLELTDD